MSDFLGAIRVLFYLPQILLKPRQQSFKIIKTMIALAKLILQVFILLISILL